MGLNTIFSYVYWNLLEPQQGEWKYGEASNNITRYFELAQEEGLVSQVFSNFISISHIIRM